MVLICRLLLQARVCVCKGINALLDFVCAALDSGANGSEVHKLKELHGHISAVHRRDANFSLV